MIESYRIDFIDFSESDKSILPPLKGEPAKEEKLEWNSIYDYVVSKEIKLSKLKHNFVEVKHLELDKTPQACSYCGDKINIKRLESESWTSTLYCWKCKSINLTIHPDCMSGYCMQNIYVYRDKNAK